MSITRRVKRLLGLSMATAMVVALLPASMAAAVDSANEIDACDDSEGQVEFTDRLGAHEANIHCMAAFGITVGYPDGTFDTGGHVTRQQMALFIARFLTQADVGTTDIPTSDDDAFDDIADLNPDEARDAINWLAERDVTEGVGDGTSFAPGETVTRQQMASFIARALEDVGYTLPDAADAGVFADTDLIADVHLDNVLRLFADGIVEGYEAAAGAEAGDYRPGLPIQRGQMASFIVRSIGVLEEAGLWNGEFVDDDDPTDDPDFAGRTIVGASISAGEGVIFVSDGDAVTGYSYNADDQTLSVDGDAADAADFEAVLEAPNQLTVTGDELDVTTREAADVETGMLGVDGDGWAIIDGPSGIVLRDIDDLVDDADDYQVDGTDTDRDGFFDNANPGDTITVEVDDDDVRVELTNDTLEGELVTDDLDANGLVTVDINPEDVADHDDFPLVGVPVDDDHSLLEDHDVEYILNEADVDNADFVAALAVGATLTLAVEDAEATLTLTTAPAEAVTGTLFNIVGDYRYGEAAIYDAISVSQGADADPLYVPIDDSYYDVADEPEPTYVFDGEPVDDAATMLASVSAGDQVEYQPAHGATSPELHVTPADLTGQGIALHPDGLDEPPYSEVRAGVIELDDGFQVPGVYTMAPPGYDDELDLEYFVDGEPVDGPEADEPTDPEDASDWETAILSALDDGATVTLTVTQTDGAVQWHAEIG